mmetsp:Transcript_2477/g.4097  ORF Transcript_2477/g.4097 Transcript_2477/m.4097 type:complete len:116 (-) Transcript_2477:106-453(-)|eukprot:CAMPEP_0184543840 /NCGR_PEP_ID=MMETSP0199_2-20130426/3204_1 /TAXON_ID=1112570 /ORGANISM="Thraustochytrium sp., Strain LLF1b" /LENGTH=115 /DNA_ID=CAMNT_0026937917 /DNA_START=39 /DNA_END=386 /DNA_ORIENTATION=-
MSRRDIFDLSNSVGKRVRVRFQGGREVVGILRGYDQLVNVVLDEAVEYLRDPSNPELLSGETRKLGLAVCRGNSVMLACPDDGFSEIENPYADAETAQATESAGAEEDAAAGASA